MSDTPRIPRPPEDLDTTATVSVLGIGAIGGAVARALLASGLAVTVWNRSSSERVNELVVRGAAGADSAADAAAASRLVILCFTNYAAVRAVMDDISSALAGRVVVALTTGSPDDARDAARRADEAGATYIDGGVQTHPDDIGTDTATFLYSGPRASFDAHRGTFEVIGSARHLGTDPASAAVQDLALFGLWYDAQVGYLRALQIIRSTGIDLEDFVDAAAAQLGHVVGTTAETAGEVRKGSFPRGPASLTEHAPVLEQLIELRRDQHLGTGELERIHALVRQRIELGYGDDGLTSIIG